MLILTPLGLGFGLRLAWSGSAWLGSGFLGAQLKVFRVAKCWGTSLLVNVLNFIVKCSTLAAATGTTSWICRSSYGKTWFNLGPLQAPLYLVWAELGQPTSHLGSVWLADVLVSAWLGQPSSQLSLGSSSTALGAARLDYYMIFCGRTTGTHYLIGRSHIYIYIEREREREQ